MEEELPDFNKIWNYSEPETTFNEFNKLLPQAEESDNKSYHSQLLTQIARTFSLRMEFTKAHEYLDQAIVIIEKMGNAKEKSLPLVRYNLERGRAHNSNNEKVKAREFFLKAWEVGNKYDHKSYSLDAAHMMGIAETPENSVIWNEKAIKIAENAEEEKVKNWLGALYNNTAWTYHDLKDYNKALDLFEKGLEFRLAAGELIPIFIAKWTIGRTYRSLNRIDEAIEIHLNIQRERKEAGLEDGGYAFEELGECYLLKNNKQEATKNFGKAYEILSKDQWLVKNESDRLERMKKLSVA